MKKLVGIFSIILIGALVIPVNAQQKSGKESMSKKQWNQPDSSWDGWMMPWGAGRGMANNFSQAYKIIMTIHFLPELKDSLSLTDQQVNQLSDLQTDFMKKRIDWNAAAEKQMIDLRGLIDKNAPATEVQKVLQSISTNRIDMMVAGYTTYQKMLSVLNADQKTKLDKIKFHREHWSKRMMQHGMQHHRPGGGW
jgi:Spy/CpxP family protein refolding chaperone